MKYFILRGLIPEPIDKGPIGAPIFGGRVAKSRKARIKRWIETGLEIPCEGENCFLRIPSLGRLSVFVHDVYDAFLMVSARSQEKAYSLALPLRAFITVYLGMPLEEGFFEYLIELKEKPKANQSRRHICQLYRNIWESYVDFDQLCIELGSGFGLRLDQLRHACQFVRTVLSSRQMGLCLIYLERSHRLLSGYMSGSYYHYHYQHDRRAESSYARRKKYLENHTMYDVAFLSAFRAIEALLGTSNLRSHEINNKLIKLDNSFGTSFATCYWHSYHEVFSSGRKQWSILEIIKFFLKIRNAVAAHANPKPPMKLTEDQVFEIQRLVEDYVI
jgi:hypothetical protein